MKGHGFMVGSKRTKRIKRVTFVKNGQEITYHDVPGGSIIPISGTVKFGRQFTTARKIMALA